MKDKNRRDFLKKVGGGSLAALADQQAFGGPGKHTSESLSPGTYQIGAYYVPVFHVDARIEIQHGKGWTEWELVKRGEAKYQGHQQPKVPLWGYEDESDPKVFEKKITAAADHGLQHFIFDWYWYDDGPFLNKALDQGFLHAANNHRLRFSIMWANHDWHDIHPAKLHAKPPLLYHGAVARDTFEKMTDYIVKKYFSHPSYWKIEGRPYFSIYELYRLIEGLGGVSATQEALQSFRNKTRAQGFPDLHLNAVLWGLQTLPTEQQITNPNQLLSTLNCDSVTSYVWVHDVGLPHFPVTEYGDTLRGMVDHWRKTTKSLEVPYFPNVTMGWDPSPRACQSDVYMDAGYPFEATLGGNTPARFREALLAVKEFLGNREDRRKVITINAWNEWTEGSYLEPDTVHKMEYLQAIRYVFAPTGNAGSK